VPAQIPTPGDYGDARDDVTTGYPTLYTSTNTLAGRRGPYHRNIDDGLIGPSPNSVNVEAAAQVVDMDIDDGTPFFYVELVSLPAPTWFSIDVSVDANAPDQTRYLNVLIDHNNDNDWAEIFDPFTGHWTEWVMQNRAVRVPPGETRRIQSSEFGFSPDLLLFPVQVRVTITPDPIDPGALAEWDGSGPDTGFVSGETEDYIVTRNGVAGRDEDDNPVGNMRDFKFVECRPVPRRNLLPDGATITFDVVCNYRGTLPLDPLPSGSTGVEVSIGPCRGDPLFIDGVRMDDAGDLSGPRLISGDPANAPDCLGPASSGCSQTITQTWTASGWPVPPPLRRAVCNLNYDYDPFEETVLAREEVIFIEPPAPIVSMGVPDTLLAGNPLETLIVTSTNLASEPLSVTEGVTLTFPVTLTTDPDLAPPEFVAISETVEISPPIPGDFTFFGGVDYRTSYDAYGLFAWQPGVCEAGRYDIVFTGEVLSGTALVSQEYTATIQVINQNTAPTSITLDPSSEGPIPISNTLTVNITAQDPDVGVCTAQDRKPQDRLFLSAGVQAEDSIATRRVATEPDVTDNGDGTGSFTWTPTAADVGQHTLTFTATDAYLRSISTTLTLEVTQSQKLDVFMPLIIGDAE
jgi:hypothetical protein